MSRYRRLPSEVDAEVWLGSPASYASIERFVGAKDATPNGGRVLRGWNVTSGLLSFWCEKSKALVLLEPGGAIVREPTGTGYYPISPMDFAAFYVALPDDYSVVEL